MKNQNVEFEAREIPKLGSKPKLELSSFLIRLEVGPCLLNAYAMCMYTYTLGTLGIKYLYFHMRTHNFSILRSSTSPLLNYSAIEIY